MECPICFNTINNSCTGSCSHYFCYKCLLKWCYLGNYNCPMCKQYIYEIVLDNTFDLINNPNQKKMTFTYSKTIDIMFHDNTIPGITLQTNKGPGVKIVKLKKNGRCYREGLRVNDIILYLNNVPCTHHVDSINIINYTYKNRSKLFVELLEDTKNTISLYEKSIK